MPVAFILMPHDGDESITIKVPQPGHCQCLPVFDFGALLRLAMDFINGVGVAGDDGHRGMLVDANLARLSAFRRCSGCLGCGVVQGFNLIRAHPEDDGRASRRRDVERGPRVAPSLGQHEPVERPLESGLRL